MEIWEKYPQDYAVHRDIVTNSDDAANSTLFCGFCHRTGCANSTPAFFNQEHYSCVYVIYGDGVYQDAATSKIYDIGPGCIIRRMPGVNHYSRINTGSKWLEFYFTAPKSMFDHLVTMKLLCAEPVSCIGYSKTIKEKILKYISTFENTEMHRSAELLPDIMRMICFFESYKKSDPRKEWADGIATVFKNNLNVGIPLEYIAKECNMSYASLRKNFSATFGCSMEQYRIQLRISEAKSMLINNNMSIKEVAATLGYCDSYAFATQFKQQTGISPGKFVSEFK